MNNNKEKLGSYEIIFITKKEDKEKTEKLSDDLEKIGKLENLSLNIWKEMKPAYRVKDIEENEYALYFLVNFSCQKDVVSLVEEIIKSNSSIRRYRILNVERDSKKMKVGRIQNPKPRIRKRAPNFSRERNDYKSRERQENSSSVSNS